MDSRAAVFTTSPQTVEVYQAGTWWAGDLLGWRHDASGTCQMWVRVVVGGVEETAWIDLAALRLPDAEPAPGVTDARIDPRVKQVLPPAQAISALRGRAVAADAEATAALPLIRHEASASAGTHRAAERRTGRRRAPEEGGPAAAPVEVAAAPVAAGSAPAGRHRAPDDEGRHRAADTEVFAAVPAASDEFATDQFATVQTEPAVESRRSAARPHAGAGWSVPAARPARPEESLGRSEVCTGRIDVEPDLLTRPMRLSDLAASPRRPRVSRSRTA